MGLVLTDRPPEGAVPLRTYTSAPAAEAAAAALRSAGFDCWLAVDDAGGMFPFLDTSSGIRLFVSASDAQTAAAFLDALPSPDAPPPTDTVTPPNETAASSPSPSPIRWIQIGAGLVLGVLLCLFYQWAARSGTKTYRRDLNGDGKMDVVWRYVGGYAREASFDRNFDGIVVRWDYFDASGDCTVVKADENFDTQPDLTWTYTNGVLALGFTDTDFNGVPDCTTTFAQEMPIRADWRPNGTKVITLRQIFRHGVLAEELRDTNFDGSFDLTTQYDPFQNPVATNAFILLSPAAL